MTQHKKYGKPIEELKGKAAKLKLDLALGKLKDTNAVSKKRRELARALTTLRQKEVIKNA